MRGSWWDRWKTPFVFGLFFSSQLFIPGIILVIHFTRPIESTPQPDTTTFISDWPPCCHDCNRYRRQCRRSLTQLDRWPMAVLSVSQSILSHSWPPVSTATVMAAGAGLWIAALMDLVVAGLRSGHSHSWPQISLAVGAGLWIAALMVIREYGRRCW